MDDGKEIGKRLKEFAVSKFKSVSALERALEMPVNSLSQYVGGRVLPGVKLRERLRAKGCDIDYVMTGRRGDEPVGDNPARLYYDVPAHFTGPDADRLKDIIEKIGKISKHDTHAIETISSLIDVTFKRYLEDEDDGTANDMPPRKLPRFDGDLKDERKIHENRLDRVKAHK